MSAQDRYRAFAASEPQLPLCFQPWYLDAVCAGGSWGLALQEEDKQITGVWTWFEKKFLGLPYLTMPHFTKWMGPWLHPGRPGGLTQDHERLTALMAQLPRVVKQDQDCHPSLQNWLPMYWAGYQQSTRYTYILQVDDLEQVKAGCNRNVRRTIHKGESRLHLEEQADIAVLYLLLEKSFARQHLSLPYSLPLLTKHIQSLEENHAVKLFFALDDAGNYHGASALSWDQHRAYYHLSGDDPTFRESGAGIYLTWKAIEYTQAHLRGRVFDFLGSMLPGVELVRRNFGARQEPYFRISKWPFGKISRPG